MRGMIIKLPVDTAERLTHTAMQKTEMSGYPEFLRHVSEEFDNSPRS